MKILNKNININFSSGLTTKLLLKEKCTNPCKLETYLNKEFGIETNFSGNKTMAYANTLCAQIFQKLSKKMNFNFLFPPFIRIYNKTSLIEKNSASNFCIHDSKAILIDDNPFPGRSIFFENIINLKYINEKTEESFIQKYTSSPHFLAPFIHEWLHSIQLDFIYNNYGYGGKCAYLTEQYPDKSCKPTGFEIIASLQNKKLSLKENMLVYDILGKYATLPYNQYLEIFSETWTKFICDSLSGTQIVKNPIELLKETPKEFQNIVRKICSFK